MKPLDFHPDQYYPQQLPQHHERELDLNIGGLFFPKATFFNHIYWMFEAGTRHIHIYTASLAGSNSAISYSLLTIWVQRELRVSARGDHYRMSSLLPYSTWMLRHSYD
jgi:hypothetical protein